MTDPTHEPLGWEEFRELATPPPGVRLSWGEGPLAVGELRLPEGQGPYPVAVVVHGGCWQSIADPVYMRHLAEALIRRGWATWSIGFRRTDDEGGAWPGTLRDVGRATDHLRSLAPRHALDLHRVVSVGHSSGGHLALWLAARPGLPATPEAAPLRGPSPIEIHGVAAFAPIADLADFHRRSDRECSETAVEDLLGGTLEAHGDRLGLADPAARLPLGVPQLLVTGLLDPTVPPGHVRTYAERARAAGDEVTVVEVGGAGHFEVMYPEDPTWRVTGAALTDLLERLAR